MFFTKHIVLFTICLNLSKILQICFKTFEKMSTTDEKVDALPNILITGTPGVGKSYLCQRICEQLKLNWIDCSKVAKEKDFIEEYDEEYACPILDEDKLMDYMEPLMQEGGQVVEYHGCDFFPERWFQAVFVVTCPSNTILFDRLKERDYNEKKLKSNLECEIFGTMLEEAKESYKPDIVFELKGETKQDAEQSLKTIKSWYRAWKRK